MIGLFLIIIISVGVLTGLLILFFEDAINPQAAIPISIPGSIGTMVVFGILSTALGFIGVLFAVVINTVIFGLVLMAITGAGFQRSALAGGVWSVVYVGIRLGLDFVFTA